VCTGEGDKSYLHVLTVLQQCQLHSCPVLRFYAYVLFQALLTRKSYVTSSLPLIYRDQTLQVLPEEQYQSNHLLRALYVIHEDTLPTHHVQPNIPKTKFRPCSHVNGQYPGLTSGKLEQILAIDSLTCNCVSENPLVSINVFA
jgi:hypothetical protein